VSQPRAARYPYRTIEFNRRVIASPIRSLEHRGHVIGISMMCALDSLSRFASVEEGQRARVTAFVRNFFPFEFSAFADTIYTGFRNG
jgi:hypothetical protein